VIVIGTQAKTQATIESGKEMGRLLLIAIVSYLLTTGVLDTLVAFVFRTHLSPDQRLQLTGLIMLLLRALDAWLHEMGKQTNNPRLIRGLVQF